MTDAILITTDFSELSEAAFPHAVRFATAMKRPLRLVHVSDALPPEGTERHKAWEADMTAYLDSQMQTFSERLASYSDIEVETRCLAGVAAHELLEEIENGVALTVIATHCRAPLSRLLLGSVASKVIRGAVSPVLAVGAEVADRPIERVLLPTDFSELTTGALDTALGMVQQLSVGQGHSNASGTQVEFFHAYLPRQASQISYGGLLPESGKNTDLRERCANRLDDFARDAEARGLSSSRTLGEGRRPADAIISHIETTDPDLIIMPAHGYTGLGRWLLGSVTEEVVRRSHRPVLVLKPGTAKKVRKVIT